VRRLLLVAIGFAVVIGAVLLGALLGKGGPADQKPGVVATSAPLPPVAGSTLEGGTFSSADHRGHVLVLNFWNPYCAPCRAEATVLDVGQGRLGPQGVVIAGVLFSNRSFPHDVPAAKHFARDLGERYPTVDDASGALAAAFGVRGIPTTVVADATGRIRYEVFGALKGGELEELVRRVRGRR
jgi:cytochrome c biogenesis protein CcmG/thiol:disulfide interchange protein DsbE